MFERYISFNELISMLEAREMKIKSCIESIKIRVLYDEIDADTIEDYHIAQREFQGMLYENHTVMTYVLSMARKVIADEEES